MIDARTWVPPSPADVRTLIERAGLSQQEVGRRLGVGGRRVRSWVAYTNPQPMRYCEWLALGLLVSQARTEHAA